jgi:hypothetical protein
MCTRYELFSISLSFLVFTSLSLSHIHTHTLFVSSLSISHNNSYKHTRTQLCWLQPNLIIWTYGNFFPPLCSTSLSLFLSIKHKHTHTHFLSLLEEKTTHIFGQTLGLMQTRPAEQNEMILTWNFNKLESMFSRKLPEMLYCII